MGKMILLLYTLGAAVFDMKTEKIPNGWVFGGALAGFAAGLFSYGPISLLRVVPCILLAAALLPARKRASIGGGDIKLLSGCALCLPPLRYPLFLLGSMAAAAFFAAVRILRKGRGGPLLQERLRLAPAVFAAALFSAAGIL